MNPDRRLDGAEEESLGFCRSQTRLGKEGRDGWQVVGGDVGLPAEKAVEQSQVGSGQKGSKGIVRHHEIRPDPTAVDLQGLADIPMDVDDLVLPEAVEEELGDYGSVLIARQPGFTDVLAAPGDAIHRVRVDSADPLAGLFDHGRTGVYRGDVCAPVKFKDGA